MGNIKANKKNGHKREAEAGKYTQFWRPPYTMVRTGLDGGHDLRGDHCVGEVKAVRTGPKWLQDGLTQMNNSPEKLGFLITCLSQGPGRPVRWLVTMDLADFEAEFVGGVYDEEETMHTVQ